MAISSKLFWWNIRSWIKAKMIWFIKDISTILIGVLSLALLLIIILLLCRIFDASETMNHLDKLLGTTENVNIASAKYQTLRTLGLAIFSLGALIGIAIAHRRAEAQFGANKEQRKANETQFQSLETQRQASRDKIYNDAITHLGHEKPSVRLGGAYALYELSQLEPNRLKNIAEILCAHVREATQQEGYLKKYLERPSNEVQSILNLLSKLNETYHKEEFGVQRLLDLSHTHLNGANLERARLQYANLQDTQMQATNLNCANMKAALLQNAQMQEAKLNSAKMQEANLSGAQMQEAELERANLQRAFLPKVQLSKAILVQTRMQDAYLPDAQMQGASLIGIEIQGANLRDAKMQGAHLDRAKMQEAFLPRAQMQGAILEDAQMQGSHLQDTQMQGVDLSGTQMQGANLSGAQMQGADLHNTNMVGAFATESKSSLSWLQGQKARIRTRRNKDTELETVIWSGEKNVGDMEKIEKTLKKLVQEGKLISFTAEDIIQKISSHKGKPPKYKPIPKEVITGKLTDEIVDEFIKNYEKAIKSKSK